MKENSTLLILLCIVETVTVNQIFVNAIIFNNHSSHVGFISKENVVDFNLLFNATSSLCVTYECEEIFNGLIEWFKNDYTLIIRDNFTKPILTCVRVFVLKTDILSVIDCERVFASYHKTVVYVVDDSISADFLYSLEACLVMAQSQDVFALSLSDSSLFQLSPVYPQPRHFLRTTVAEVLHQQVKKSKRLDFEGSELTIGFIYYVPYFMDVESNLTSKDEYDGLHVPLFKEMARQLNSTCTFVVYDSIGIILDNGTWSGGLGQDIKEGNVDILGLSMWEEPENYRKMDFGPFLYKDSQHFLVMRPEVIEFNWEDEVLHIFQPIVWFAILGSFVLTVLVYWVGVNWDPRPCTESWSGCILTILGYFTTTTSHSRVKDGNTRFSLTGWSVFSLLITSSLCKGIVTRLTIPLYSPRINTIEQLVEGEYFWSVQYYEELKNTPFKEIHFDLENHWFKLFEKRYVYMDEDEVTRTAGTDKKIAYIVELYGDFVNLDTDGLYGHKNLKNYRVSKDPYRAGHTSFGVKKHSFLSEALSDLAQLMIEAGLVSHLQEEVIRRWPQYDIRHLLIEQDIPTFSEPRGLPFYKLQPVFLLLLLGLGLASIGFLTEICWKLTDKVFIELLLKFTKSTQLCIDSIKH